LMVVLLDETILSGLTDTQLPIRVEIEFVLVKAMLFTQFHNNI